MQHKNSVFATSLFALLLMLFVQAVGHTDTYNKAATNGHVRLDGVNTTAFNCNASVYYSSSTGLTQIWGSMSIMNNTLYVGSSVAAEVSSSITLAGVSVKHAVITSKPFTYSDPNTKTSYTAHLIFTLTQVGPYGQGGFQVIRNADGAVVAQTSVAGVYAEVPFYWGYVAIQ